MSKALRTALIGFGKMGHGYAQDPLMARYYRYAAHAQVLADHAAFDWTDVVDPEPAARSIAVEEWGVSAVGSVADIPDAAHIEVAVIATPPETRIGILDELPGLRAVLVEKPLGTNLAASQAFLDACAARKIAVQVNLWRRADERFRELADGGLVSLVGKPQAVTGYYGNGLLNNGTHMVDFVRMLLGEIASVQCVGVGEPLIEGPIAGDTNPAFALQLDCGLVVGMQPLRFADFRENGLSIWGVRGRLDILNEGLVIRHFPRRPNRAMMGEQEIASDEPLVIGSTVGMALHHMYSNLAASVQSQSSLWSSGLSALRTSEVVDAVLRAPANGMQLGVRKS